VSRGILFDFQSVLDGAAVEPSVRERLDCIPGNFFETIPIGGDVYILRQILHNWNEADAARILRRCREAITSEARLLITKPHRPR
jgi:hypothetical protein